MRFHTVLTLSIGLSATLHNIVTEAASVEDFQDFSTTFLPGRLYVPPEAGDRPLILFLHGAGEIGGDNISQIGSNIDNLLNAAKQRGAFLYAPQAGPWNFMPSDWGVVSRTTTVMAMIDQAISEYRVDPTRLYVTGLSMGGGGTWDMMNRHSDRFAAGVPIAGVKPSKDFDATKLVEEPIWAFHARNDGVVTVARSRDTINSILAASGEPTLTYPPITDPNTFEYVNDNLQMNYTEWATGGHGIWWQVYDTTEMYDWMFSKTTAVPEPSTGLLMGMMFIQAARSPRLLAL